MAETMRATQGLIPEFELHDRMKKTLPWSGTSVGDIAEYLGVTRETVSRWVNGKIVPSRQTLRLWALRTGVPFEWLETGKVPSPAGDGTFGECAIRDSNPEPADKWSRAGLPQLTALDRYRHKADVKRVRRAGVAA